MSEFWQGFCWGIGVGIVVLIAAVVGINAALNEAVGRGLGW